MSWVGYSCALAAVAASPAARASAIPPPRSHGRDLGFMFPPPFLSFRPGHNRDPIPLPLVGGLGVGGTPTIMFCNPHPVPPHNGEGTLGERRPSELGPSRSHPHSFLKRLLTRAAELRQHDEGEHEEKGQ